MLVDTASWGLGVPIYNETKWRGFEYVNVTEAGGELLPCDSPQCVGACQQSRDAISSNYTCGPHGGLCVRDGDKSICGFKWKYGDNSTASGVLVRSDIVLGGAKVSSVFGGITSVQGAFYEAPKGGGIMGMSFGNYTQCTDIFPTCFNPVLDAMVEGKGLEDRWALCTYDRAGKLVLGGGDDQLYEGPLKQVRLLPPFRGYHVDILEATLGGEDILGDRSRFQGKPSPFRGLRDSDNMTMANGNLRGVTTPIKGAQAVLDSGTAWLMLPSEIYAMFNASLIRAAPELNDPMDIFRTGLARMPNETLAKLPDLKFRLESNVTLSFTPEDYLPQYRDIRGIRPVVKRLLTVLPSNHFILGQIALNKLYLEFDRTNKVLGIAPARAGCKPADAA